MQQLLGASLTIAALILIIAAQLLQRRQLRAQGRGDELPKRPGWIVYLASAMLLVVVALQVDRAL